MANGLKNAWERASLPEEAISSLLSRLHFILPKRNAHTVFKGFAYFSWRFIVSPSPSSKSICPTRRNHHTTWAFSPRFKVSTYLPLLLLWYTGAVVICTSELLYFVILLLVIHSHKSFHTPRAAWPCLAYPVPHFGSSFRIKVCAISTKRT